MITRTITPQFADTELESHEELYEAVYQDMNSGLVRKLLTPIQNAASYPFMKLRERRREREN